MGVETEMCSSAQTQLPAIYTGQSFSTLFFIYDTFQVILGQIDANIVNSLDF